MIKRKLKKCKTCEKDKVIFSNGNCKYCANKTYVAKPKTKVQKLINKDVRNIPLKQLKSTLDDWYSYYIRLKYTNDQGFVSCVTCGKTVEPKEIQNGHYISRNNLATRFLDKNCHPQCFHCNVVLKGNYPKYSLFLINKYGPDVLDHLDMIKRNKVNWGRFEYTVLINDYQLKVGLLLKQKNIKPWFPLSS